MANVTLKNVPDELFKLLKIKARQNGRSLNSEIIIGLQRYLAIRERNAQELIDHARRARAMATGALSTQEVDQAINSGRP
jgi:plasmid stability protein